MTWSVPGQKPPANGVPAAAVIRRGQALSGIIGRKARAGAPLRSACARFTPNNSGQRLPPTYYRGCWHVVSRGFLVRYRQRMNSYSHTCSSLTTELYDPKTFFAHAALLRQTCVHCGRFPTAASRRSLGRVSVPVWPITLSGRLRIVALVSLYLTN